MVLRSGHEPAAPPKLVAADLAPEPPESARAAAPDIPLDTAPVMLSPFTGNHFNLWKFQILCIFRSRGLLHIADGIEAYDPHADLATRRYWKRCDQQAMDILIQTMDRSLVRPLLRASSAHEMWQNLQLHYDKRAISSVHSLQKRLFDLKHVATKGIRSFLSGLNDINSQLRDMHPEKTFDDDAMISKVISSLPLDYNAFTTAWEVASPQDKTVANLSIGLVKEEAKLQTATTLPLDSSKAFYNTSKQRPPQCSSPTAVGAHNCSGSTCLHPMHKGSSSSSLPSASATLQVTTPILTPEQRPAHQRYFDELKKTTSCHNCGRSGHW